MTENIVDLDVKNQTKQTNKDLLMAVTKYLWHLMEGAQWLSGRVLDSRRRGHRFGPHRCHCVVSLSKTYLSLLSTGSTEEDPSQHN